MLGIEAAGFGASEVCGGARKVVLAEPQALQDYREAVRKGNIESISADETRCALFAALEELK